MTTRWKHSEIWLVVTVLTLACFGCSTSRDRHASATACFDNGSPEEAIAALDTAANSRGAEQEIIAVDKALAMAMAGDLATSESELRKARQRIEFLQQKDLKEQTTAVLTDDKAVAWTGREFEQRMIDNMLILTSLLGDHQDAFAYATQAMDKATTDQDETASLNPDIDIVATGHTQNNSPPAAAPRLAANALAAYLHASVHSENAMNSDITNRSLRLVSYWQGEDNGTQHKIPIGTKTRQGHGALHVITFVGRITDWHEERAAPTSAALLLADQLLSSIGDHTLPPTIAPVKIARPGRKSGNHQFLTTATVHGTDKPQVPGTTLVDLNETAWASYSHDRDQQIARAVVRRIVKKGAIYAAKDQMDVSNHSGLDLLLNVGGIAWEALEKADTRHLSLLPERIEVLQTELPAGRHKISLGTADTTNPKHNQPANITVSVDIDNARNTFLLCYRTDQRFTKIVGAAETQ